MWTPQSIDFGAIPVNKIASGEYSYTGEKVITQVKPSCSCVKVSHKSNTVQVAVNPQSQKNYLRYIYVTFEDGSKDTLELRYTAV